MLEPKRRKYRKEFRGKMRGVSIRGSTLSFGEYGLKALGRGWLSSQQLEAGRRAITHGLKKGGRVWTRVFPGKPVSARPAGQRMGGGKGEVEKYVAVITPGKIIYEITGVSYDVGKNALERAAAKLPFQSKLVKKEE